ncbi:MAG: hypothetical protein K9I59_05790 [Chlorobium sp.]|jgi:hypothetical protein|uniref:hypothetical protein n=1 Tax=Chlorobium sp. TaxID=1095 RepID=UPI0025BDD6B1|nr:hypothetical protein [Chlorobium sp.]MCF8216269.1 hypothetical protein [Chlorobium sp.]MCF8271171.1 hypothetical protein [Chlorobium sp.]MCF8287565.1 hypothetical protein [Chlorobium sp.]MCF8291084.1 hypothetical protein [Chlorobium sp.]MCF8385199.1 hypothetical protein [Chlorobium sp.]
MASFLKKTPAAPGPAIWISVTLLWGTVFFFTSSWMLGVASGMLGTGYFRLSGGELFRVYGLHIPVLLIFALTAMMVKNLLDPQGRKQVERQKSVVQGKRERLFVSFAGSIATSFFFTGLTASTFLWSSGFTGISVDLPLSVIVVAAGFNILAGLAASLLVGIVFIAAKVGRT